MKDKKEQIEELNDQINHLKQVLKEKEKLFNSLLNILDEESEEEID